MAECGGKLKAHYCQKVAYLCGRYGPCSRTSSGWSQNDFKVLYGLAGDVLALVDVDLHVVARRFHIVYAPRFNGVQPLLALRDKTERPIGLRLQSKASVSIGRIR